MDITTNKMNVKFVVNKTAEKVMCNQEGELECFR